MDGVIRRAVPGDLPDLLALYAELSVGDRLPTPEAAAATWAKLLGSEMVSVLVLERGGHVVAS